MKLFDSIEFYRIFKEFLTTTLFAFFHQRRLGFFANHKAQFLRIEDTKFFVIQIETEQSVIQIKELMVVVNYPYEHLPDSVLMDLREVLKKTGITEMSTMPAALDKYTRMLMSPGHVRFRPLPTIIPPELTAASLHPSLATNPYIT